MKIGDIIQRIPETFGETEIVQAKDRKQPKKERKPFTGTVTYIHPLRRYHVVSFRVRGGVIRESFAGARDRRRRKRKGVRECSVSNLA